MISKIKKALIYIAVFALILQSSLILNFFNPQKAHAQVVDTIQYGCVVINEVMWTGSPASTNDEWLELKSNHDSPIDFSVTPFSIYRNGALMVVINSGVLNPGGYFLISRYSETSGSSILNVTPDLIASFSLLNSDVQYKLYASADDSGVLVDTADDGNSVPLAGDNANKYSMERNAIPGDGTLAENWHTATAAVNFDQPTTAKGTPKAVNSSVQADEEAPVITLLGANPQTIEKGNAYTELGATALDNVDGDISANIVIDSSNVNTNAVGVYQVTYNVSDAAGNPAQEVIRTINVVDTTAPTGSININDGAGVTNARNVTLNLTASADTTEMQIANDALFTTARLQAVPNWEPFSVAKAWMLTAGNGQKTVYVKFRDSAGNVSATYSDKIYYHQDTSNIVTTPIIGDGQTHTINPVPGLELDINASLNTTLTTATYSQNPGNGLPSGISAFGRYFEMDVTNNLAINWPVMIRIYYTEQDLAAAGITNENQLLGIYYYDGNTEAWKLYSNTGVNTNNVNGYAGYIWANADHLTPIASGADITNPDKPANFTAEAGDGEISLKWDKVNEAVGYYVRYRQGTTADTTGYSTIYLEGNNSTSTKVTGLKNGVLYEFGVWAVDSVGNESKVAVVVASPIALITLAKAETITAKPQAKAEEVTPGKGETEITTIGPEEGEVKSDSATNWTRFWITLAILIIAAGAAYGGYYGYQWWMARPQKPKTPSSPPKTPQGTGRW